MKRGKEKNGKKGGDKIKSSPCQMHVNSFNVKIQHCIQCLQASMRQASLMLVSVVPPGQQLSFFLLIIDVTLMLKQGGLEISFKPAVPWLPAPDPSAASPRACHMKHSHTVVALTLKYSAHALLMKQVDVVPPLPLWSARRQCLASQNKSTLGFFSTAPKHIRGQEMKDGRCARFGSFHLDSVFIFSFTVKSRQSVMSFISSVFMSFPRHYTNSITLNYPFQDFAPIWVIFTAKY